MAAPLSYQQVQYLVAKARQAYYSHCLPSTQFYVQKLVNQNVTDEQQRELLFFHQQSQGACKCCLQRLIDMEKRQPAGETRDPQAVALLYQANQVLTAQLAELRASIQNSYQPRDYLLEETKVLRYSNEELRKYTQEQTRELSYLQKECQRLYKYEQKTCGLAESYNALQEQLKAVTEQRDDAYRQLYQAKLETEQLKYAISQLEDQEQESYKDSLIKELRSYVAAVASKKNAQFEATYDQNVLLKQQIAEKQQRIVYLEQLYGQSKTAAAAASLRAKEEYIQALKAQQQKLQDKCRELNEQVAKERDREQPAGAVYAAGQIEELMSALEQKNQQLCHSNKIILDLQRQLRDFKEKGDVQRSPDNTLDLRTTFAESYLEAQELANENQRLKDAFKVLYNRFSAQDTRIQEYVLQIAQLESYLEAAQQIVAKQTEQLRFSLKNQNDEEYAQSTLQYQNKKMTYFVYGAVKDLQLMTKVGRYYLAQHAHEVFLLLERTVNYVYKRLGAHYSALLEQQQNEHASMVSEMGNYLALSQHTADSSVAQAIQEAENQTQQIMQKNEEITELKYYIYLLTAYAEQQGQVFLISQRYSAESEEKLRYDLYGVYDLHGQEIELWERRIRDLYNKLQASKRRIALLGSNQRKLGYLLGSVLERLGDGALGTHTLAIRYLAEQFAIYADNALHFGNLLLAEKKRLCEMQQMRSRDFDEIVALKRRLEQYDEQQRSREYAHVCQVEKLKGAEQRIVVLEERAVQFDRLRQKKHSWYLSLVDVAAELSFAKEALQRTRNELSMALQADCSRLEDMIKLTGNKMTVAFSKQAKDYTELLTSVKADLEVATAKFLTAENSVKAATEERNTLFAQLQEKGEQHTQLAEEMRRISEELTMTKQAIEREQSKNLQLESIKNYLQDYLQLQADKNAELSTALAQIQPYARRQEYELYRQAASLKAVQEEMQARELLHEKAIYRCRSDCEEKQLLVYRLTTERDEAKMQQQAQAVQMDNALYHQKQAEGQIIATYELERHNNELERQICEEYVAKQLLTQQILLLKGRIQALGQNVSILVNSTNYYTEKKFGAQLTALPLLEGDLQRLITGLLSFAYEMEQLVFGFRAHIAEVLQANRRVAGEFAQALREKQHLVYQLEGLYQYYVQQQKLVYKQTYDLEAQKNDIYNFIMTLERQKNTQQKQKELVYYTKDLYNALGTKDRYLGLLGSKIYALYQEVGEKQEQLNQRQQQFQAQDMQLLRVENDFYTARDNLRQQVADNEALKQYLAEYQRQASVMAESLAAATSQIKQMGHENYMTKAELERSRDLLRAQGDELARARSSQP